MTENTAILHLEGTLTIKTATETHERLTAAIENAHAGETFLQINISDDCSCDLTLPQLLLAARTAAQTRGVKLSIRTGEQGAFATTFERAGFTSSDMSGSLSCMNGDKQ